MRFTRSEAEERFLVLVGKARLPAPEVNVAVGDHEVDFLWRRARLVVEVDGYAFHSSPGQFERDRRRDAELSAAGLLVLRVTWQQIANEPEAMLVNLGQALARQSAGIGDDVSLARLARRASAAPRRRTGLAPRKSKP